MQRSDAASLSDNGESVVLILRLQICCTQRMMDGPAVLANLEVIPSVPHEEEGDKSLIRVAICIA